MTADVINAYLDRAREIIGERSPAEKAYDDEVVAGLDKGLGISAAIKAANAKFPDEALQFDSTTQEDIQEHFEYLAEHMKILRRLGLRE